MHWGACGWRITLPAALIVVVALEAPASAQKTDIVTLANGDRITGEVSTLDRGRLEYKTDDEGTIYLEWDKIATVTSTAQFEVGTSDGRRFVGSLRSEGDRVLVVVETTGPVPLPMADVTMPPTAPPTIPPMAPPTADALATPLSMPDVSTRM